MDNNSLLNGGAIAEGKHVVVRDEGWCDAIVVWM